MANWHIEAGNGNINNGRLCLTSPSSSMLLGWTAPANVTLDGATHVSHLVRGVRDVG